MTEKPDYMQKADESASSHRCMRTALARTLEAIDTERAAHDATKAELQALRGSVASAAFTLLAQDCEDGAFRVLVDVTMRQFLTTPEPEPLVVAISEAIGEYIMPGATWGELPKALARHGLKLTAIGGKHD